MNNIKKVYTGTSDFKELIEGDYPFVDKTLFIKDFIDNNSKVTLLPRPRRFGKTLNMSMLTYFFDMNEDSKELFKGLRISKEKECLEHINQYPVISISFKGSSTENWEVTQKEIENIIAEEYKKNAVIKDVLDKGELEEYELVENKKAPMHVLRRSIMDLSRYLERKHNKRVIIIVDEYDAAMHKMYNNENFKKCMDLFKGIYEYAFKGNKSLEKGLLTGIFQVAQQGIFSGMNNADVFTVLSEEFSEHFRFLEEEVKPLLEIEGIDIEETKSWYNGYKFGELTIYNPWSILKLLKSRKHEVYWKNTGLGVQTLIFDALKNQRGLVEMYVRDLLEGKSVIAKVQEGLVLEKIKENKNAFWSLLLYAGYLTPERKLSHSEYYLKIPNEEVREFYLQILEDIKSEVVGSTTMELLIDGRIEEFEKVLNEKILKGTSYFDQENFYHGVMYAMAVTLEGFEVESNREAGIGRLDLVLEREDIGLVIEVKRTKGSLEKSAGEALQQIKGKRYHEKLKSKKIKIVGMAFKEKKCKVVSEDIVV